MKLTTTEKIILADTLEDIINDSRKSGVDRPELVGILTKISLPKLFSVWTVEDRIDRNYLVRAVSMEEASSIIENEGDGKVRSVTAVTGGFMYDMEFDEKDIPTEAGSWYMYDEGT